MFRDLKEYQEIQRIYQESVYDSPDDKLLEEAFKEFNTLEELDYLEENLEYVIVQENLLKSDLSKDKAEGNLTFTDTTTKWLNTAH